MFQTERLDILAQASKRLVYSKKVHLPIREVSTDSRFFSLYPLNL